jgi:peptide/nickel transport system substrate-binding protein
MIHINETLLALEDDKLVPLLAESWKILPGNSTYEFVLKQGVKFHNGETLGVDDVVFSLKRASAPGNSVGTWSAFLKDAEKVDDRTVRLQTTIPLGDAFLGSLTHPWASILSRKAVEEAGQDYGQKPVGTGRFTLKRLIPGDRVELERFDGYHGDKAKLRAIIFRTYLEATTRAIELESGALDVAIDISPVDVNRIRDNPKLEIVTTPSWRNYHIGFDTAGAPFDNPLVRQAINLAINREGIVKAVYRGFAQASRGAFPSTVAYSSYENAPELPYDPKKAKELLVQAGFPDGFKSGFIVPERSDFQNIATVLQNNLREIGIEFTIRVTEYGAITELIRQKGHDPYLNNLGNAPTSNPVFSIDPLVHSRFLGKSNYFLITHDIQPLYKLQEV